MCGRAVVVEVSLHFPIRQVELSVGTTVKAYPIRLTMLRERPAHRPVPTTKEASYPTLNFLRC